MSELKENTQRSIDVTQHDLPLHCPMSDMVSWNSHPRVFLPIQKTGTALCPYCGTHYQLTGPVSNHH
ncbi:zinc-finger domain-containing protein [Neisseriaceae bacterium TC5R-5]|nr:zinc-finger domain-containing protein [Neisseriaceae bacterium TC5R-5]